MVTQLDDVVTFLGKSGTVAVTVTVKHVEDSGSLRHVGSGNRILVNEPGLTSYDWGILEYTYDYDCLIDVDTEANYTILLDGLKTNIDKLNRRETITSYTKPATLVRVTLTGERMKFARPSNRVHGEFTLRVTWRTA